MKKRKINKKKIAIFCTRLFFIFCFITSILCLIKHANVIEQKNGQIIEQNVIQQAQEVTQEQNVTENIIENTTIENVIIENEQPEEKVEETQVEEVKTEQNKPTTQTVTSRGGYTSLDREETPKQNNGEWIKFTATGYCACMQCCGKTNGITASGTKATAGRTIAMPKGYAFGTKIEIQGKGIYIVEDRGGAINGNKLDIYFNTHQEALNWGRRTVYIRVVQ